MTAWTRIREVFEEVVDLEPGARGPRLDALCADDVELRARVERLLAEDTADVSVPIEAPPPVDLVALDPTRLRRIGSYEIVRVLGAGGMGTVFEALQERPRRTVALKVLRTLVASDIARRRLEYEAETLGRLQHPHIAQVHESGTWRDPDTGEESPFFAMEFVPGARPLDVFADAERLDLRQRIELFLGVCDAVHHGHQVGVLHRDLKPGNLLVGDDGRPKVIDFGIARATDAVDDGRTLQTLTGQVLGTLGYMSPEQLDADLRRIDVRTDVYSLGATLYELLVGRTPHERSEESLPRFVERVRNVTPRRPSACADARVDVPAELDWVVLCALAPEPEDRYASVSELAADLRRFLADEPLVARPPTTGYVLRKFVRRNRGLVYGSAAAFVLAVAAAVVSGLGWKRAADSEAVARLEAETQSAVTRYMMSMVREARADRSGREARIADMLDESEPLIAELSEGRPEVAATIREAVAESYQTLGMYEEALATIDRALADRSAGAHPDDPEVLKLLGNRVLALTGLDRGAEARPLAEDVLARRLAQVGERDRIVAQMLSQLAELDFADGDFDSAEANLRRASRIHAWFAEHAERPGLRERNRMFQLNARASLCTVLARRGEHVAALRDGAELLREMDGLFSPGDAAVISLRETLAGAASMAGRFEEAIAHARAVVDGRVHLFGDGPKVLGARSSLATVLTRAGRLDEAIAELEAVVAVHDRRGDRDRTAATSRYNLAAALERADRLEDAERRFTELFEKIDPERVPAGSWLFAQFRKGYGACLRKLGKLDEAEAELLAALPVLAKSFGDANRRVQLTLRELVELYRQKGDDAARERYETRLSSSR